MKKIKNAVLFLSLLFMSTSLLAQKNKPDDTEYEVQFLRVGVEGTILFLWR